MASGSAVQGMSVSIFERWQKDFGLQVTSASCFWSKIVGSAGRRRRALFSVGWPARVLNFLAESWSQVGS